MGWNGMTLKLPWVLPRAPTDMHAPNRTPDGRPDLPLDVRMCRLLGRWLVKGREFPEPTERPRRVEAVELFEPAEGQPMLKHQFRGYIASDAMAFTELIGNNVVLSSYIDGHEQVWTSTFQGEKWVISGTWNMDGEHVYMRCITHFAGEARRYAVWERSNDGVSWTTFRELECTKVRTLSLGFAA